MAGSCPSRTYPAISPVPHLQGGGHCCEGPRYRHRDTDTDSKTISDETAPLHLGNLSCLIALHQEPDQYAQRPLHCDIIIFSANARIEWSSAAPREYTVLRCHISYRQSPCKAPCRRPIAHRVDRNHRLRLDQHHLSGRIRGGSGRDGGLGGLGRTSWRHRNGGPAAWLPDSLLRCSCGGLSGHSGNRGPRSTASAGISPQQGVARLVADIPVHCSHRPGSKRVSRQTGRAPSRRVGVLHFDHDREDARRDPEPWPILTPVNGAAS